jgi:hypothetical protein
MIADSSLYFPQRVRSPISRCNEGKQGLRGEKVTAVVRGVENWGETVDTRASVQNPATFVCSVRVKRPTEGGIRTLFLAGGIDFVRGVVYAKATFAVRFAKP